MKLSAAFSLLIDLRIGIQVALWPTILSIWHSPSLLFRPQKLSQTFFGHLWAVFGDGTDENGKPTKEKLITPYASGVVLDLGAGYGHTTKYLDRKKTTKYVALEPNSQMHDQLRRAASEAGYTESDGTLLILPYGAEDTSSILSSLNNIQVDTIISVLTLCSIPDPQVTITKLVRDLLKPDGVFLYYEHVLSPRKDVAWWQRFWAPLWALAFDGCRLDRPSHLYVEEVERHDGESIWKERKVWGKEGEPEEHLHWHRVGRYVKA